MCRDQYSPDGRFSIDTLPHPTIGPVLASAASFGIGGKADQRQGDGEENYSLVIFSFLKLMQCLNCVEFYFFHTSQNGRVAKLLTVGVRQAGEIKPSSYSRCCALVRYEASKISTDSFAIIKSLNCAGNHQQAW